MTNDRRRSWPDAIVTWLSRGELWDDVFTRTVSILLSALIIGLFGISSGLIRLNWRAAGIALIWLFIFALSGALVVYYRHQEPNEPTGWRERVMLTVVTMLTVGAVTGLSALQEGLPRSGQVAAGGVSVLVSALVAIFLLARITIAAWRRRRRH